MLGPLQAELIQVAEDVPDLSKEDYDHFSRLHDFYQMLRDTRDSFLSLGSLARIGGGLILSTGTVILTTVVKDFLETML